MRIRRIRGIEDTLPNYESFVSISDIKRIRDGGDGWQSAFNSHAPIFLECGSGKGAFGIELARRNPDKNILCIDAVPEVMIKAVKKEGIPGNLKFTLLPLQKLDTLFDDGEVARIFLNFSDPWPKKGHYKRRLTYRSFLEQYDRILADEGEIEFKTDNRGLFEFSLMELSEMGFKITEISLDLHENEPESNIRTEYENKFSAKGSKIYRLVTHRK